MVRHPLLLVLLLLAHALVDLVAWRLAEHQPIGSPAQILLIALLRAQLSLLALYLALGTAHWSLRAAGLAVGIAAWSGAFYYYPYSNLNFAETATLFVMLIAPLLLLGGIARWRGLVWGERSEDQAAGKLTRNQFSLGATFRWITLTAILLGLAKFAEFRVDYWDLWFRVSLINLLVAMAFLRGYSQGSARVIALARITLVAMLFTYFLQDSQDQGWISKFVLQAALMFGTAEVCRMAGWPIQRANRLSDTGSESDAELPHVVSLSTVRSEAT